MLQNLYSGGEGEKNSILLFAFNKKKICTKVMRFKTNLNLKYWTKRKYEKLTCGWDIFACYLPNTQTDTMPLCFLFPAWTNVSIYKKGLTFGVGVTLVYTYSLFQSS